MFLHTTVNRLHEVADNIVHANMPFPPTVL